MSLQYHEWMSALELPRPADRPAFLSLSSVEATRRNGAAVSEISRAIEDAERAAAATADFVLTPDWLCDRAGAALGLDAGRVRSFPMEGRLPNEWEAPLDLGRVKMDVGFGPLDRMILFVGPLEHAAGVDLLVEAAPDDAAAAMLAAPSPSSATAALQGICSTEAGQLGVAWAVSLLGHVEGRELTRLLRARGGDPAVFRYPFDDAVVDLARAPRSAGRRRTAARHLVRYEENGVVTYDNPGSMVWAVDRILGDPAPAERGWSHNGRRQEGSAVMWATFPSPRTLRHDFRC